jgi:cytochrome P450
MESEEKTNRMLGCMLGFGSGKFGCLGKNLARVEVLKFVPTLLREFDVSFPYWEKGFC